MSIDITVKTEKINAKRKLLADEMAILFGPYIIESDTYIFKPTFAEMGSILFLDGSLISRLLAPPNLERPTKNTVSEKSYNTILKIVKALVKQKKALTEKYETDITTLQQKLKKQTVKSTEPRNSKKTSIWKISTIMSLMIIPFIVLYYTSRGNIDAPNINAEQLNENNTLYPHLPLETIINSNFDEDEKNSVSTYWTNNGLGGPIQPTYADPFNGKTSAKLPNTGDRIGYQLIRVLKNTDYTIKFNYLMRGAGRPSGSFTMSILDENVRRSSEINSGTIASKTMNFNQKFKNKYRKDSLNFNSGIYDKVAIYFTNEGIQCKVDNLELERVNNKN